MMYIYIYIYTYVSPLAKQAPGLHPAGGNEEGDAIDGEELSQEELQELTEDCDDRWKVGWPIYAHGLWMDYV